MKNTVEDFKKHVDIAAAEEEIDLICISWLRLLAMDHGKEGDMAAKALEIVQGLLLD